MSAWTDLGAAYSRSFASLCAGTIERLLADTADGTLLDVGCGTGELGARAESLGRAVTAVDPEVSLVALARRQLRGTVTQAALPELPFPDDAFDAVVANFVVNHVSRPEESIRELGRVVLPGGRVAITIWPSNSPAPGSWTRFISDIFDEADIERGCRIDG